MRLVTTFVTVLAIAFMTGLTVQADNYVQDWEDTTGGQDSSSDYPGWDLFDNPIDVSVNLGSRALVSGDDTGGGERKPGSTFPEAPTH